ncbi:MAG: response regulator transcription factor [Thermodesulfobacteriota bacterium]
MVCKILLADNHAMVREGLAALLNASAAFQVVATASDGGEAVKMALKHRPEVVVMDVNMPGLNGMEATRQIRESLPDTPIVAISAYADKRYVRGMLQAGASAYILKENAFEDLLAAMESVRKGKRYFSPRVLDIAMDDYLNSLQEVEGSPCSRLTGREREVFQLLAEGKNPSQISDRLHVSSRTVSSHKKSLMTKLGIKSVSELALLALREGLINTD